MGLPGWLEDELLDAFAGVDFAGVEISVRIGDELVKPVELPGVAAVVAGLAEDGAVFATKGPDYVVFAVG